MISEITTDVAILYFTLDSKLVIPETLFKFKNVFIDLNLEKIGDNNDIPERIHKNGFKAVTELINPVPENPIVKLKKLFGDGFDYIYTEGIPLSAVN